MNAIVVFEYFFLIYKLKSPKKIFKDYNRRKNEQKLINNFRKILRLNGIDYR